MSNAARPTWNSATGSAKAPTFQYSSRDLNAHTKLKLRQPKDCTLRVDFNSPAEHTEISEQQPNEEKDIQIQSETHEEEVQVESENDEDDTEALLRELEKIKKEREAEKERKAQEEKEKALAANPLTRTSSTVGSSSNSFAIKRRWDDDVIFRNNQSTSTQSGSTKSKTFINDTLRSDFHRKFMKRYIK